jgi:methionyl-tRNA formyltransferase
VRTPAFAQAIRDADADIGVVIAYGRILTPAVLAAPRLGCVNVHASLLPRWRGAAPIAAALLAGDTETGVCTQQMVAELDAGDLLLSARVPIGPQETAGSLHDRLSALSAQSAVDTLAQRSSLRPVPQAQRPGGGCEERRAVEQTIRGKNFHKRKQLQESWPPHTSEKQSRKQQRHDQRQQQIKHFQHPAAVAYVTRP